MLSCAMLLVSFSPVSYNQPTVNAATATISFARSDSDSGYIKYGSTKIANPDFCSKVIVVINSLTDDSVVASTVATISGTSNTFSISGVTTGTYRLTAITPTYGEMIFDPSVVSYNGIFTFSSNITIEYEYSIDSDIWFTGAKAL